MPPSGSHSWRPWQKWIEDDGITLYGGSETEAFVPLWDLMYDGGVDVVLGGHNHIYQRWVPQDGQGSAVADGLVQFTVGTGGRSLYPFGFSSMPENLEVTQNKSFGLLKMTLHKDSYDYEWVTMPGEAAFEDSGTAVPCN